MLYQLDHHRSNNRVRLIQAGTAVVSTLAGDGRYEYADGTGTSALFRYPVDVSWSPDGSQIAVADR